MAVQISGRLTVASGERQSFEGCRIEADFDEKSSSGPRSPAVYCDAAGTFAFLFPDLDELPGETIQFVALSPAGRRIGAGEFVVADLGDDVTIEVEPFDPAPPDETPATPEHTAVKGMFEADASFRRTITEILKPLRAESVAVAHRVERAFATFSSSPLSADGLDARHYVAPDAEPGKVLDKVILDGAQALASTDNKRTMTLRKSGLDGLMTEADGDGGGAVGQVDLKELIQFINKKSRRPLTTEPAYTRCRAEMEAEAILAVVEKEPVDGNGNGVALGQGPAPAVREVDQLVKDSVNLQMHSATSPEARLDYGSMPAIPNAADTDKAQKGILQTFELRPGASDVTAYHDFHTLQIAFQHVWTRIFDEQLTSLGRDLYREYVKLKDFSGATGPDLAISTADDLRRLIEEVKKLSQIVQDDIPPELTGNGGSPNNKGTKGSDDLKRDIKTGVDIATGIATGGVSWILELAIKELSKAGNKPVIRWEDFPGPWPPRHDKIFLTVVSNVVPAGHVEIVLKTDYGSHRKIIEFEPLDPQTNRIVHGPRISTAGDGSLSTMALTTAQIATGVLEFASEETTTIDLGRFVLADLPARLKDGTRVTFYWRDN